MIMEDYEGPLNFIQELSRLILHRQTFVIGKG